MKLSIVNTGVNGKPDRTYRQFPLDGIPTIGVVAGEEFRILVTANGRRTKVLFSVDGINPRTGKPAELGPDQPGLIIEPGGTTTLTNWTETAHGGGALVFADQTHTAANYVGDTPDPIGFITVAAYVETGSASVPKMPINFPSSLLGEEPDTVYRHPQISPQRYSSPRDAVARRGFEPTREMFGGFDKGGPQDVSAQVGTGVGRHVESYTRTVPGLVKPAFAGVMQVRYLTVAQLRGKLPEYPLGFTLPAVADFGAMPRMGSERPAGLFDSDEYVHPGVLRFEGHTLL